MERTVFIYLFCFYLLKVSSQSDTNKTFVIDRAAKYYSKTDFSKIDDINKWRYKFEGKRNVNSTDLFPSLGSLIFLRIEGIDSKISQDLYGK